MTPHINAKKEEIAKTVIMPGDPLRAKHIAETFLTDYKLVNTVRNMYAYTGYYNGKQVYSRYDDYETERNKIVIIPLQDNESYDNLDATSHVEITVPTAAGGLTGNNFIKGIGSTSYVKTSVIFDENGNLVDF